MSRTVRFRAGWPHTGGDSLACGNIQMGDHTYSPVSRVIAFHPLSISREHRHRRVEPLQGLDTSHLIRPAHRTTLCSMGWSRFKDLTDGADRFGSCHRVIWWWRHLVSCAMSLHRAHRFKNAHRPGETCGQRSRV
jgi:hypothetical protein